MASKPVVAASVNRILVLVKLVEPDVVLAAQYREVLSVAIILPAVPPAFPLKTSALTTTVPPAFVVGFTNSKG